MKKAIAIGGFTKEQREKELEDKKQKYSKKGYEFIEYIDNGTLKSVAVFEVDEAYLKKEKMKNLFLLSAFFLIMAAYLFIKAS